MNRIAIIIPVFNVEKYLERCLDSLLKQTLQPTYIILIDDGSTDRSGNICDEYAKKHDFIHAIHKSNGGVGSARNYGLDLLETSFPAEYVAFVDPDDWVEKQYVANFVTRMDNVDLCICGYQEDLQNDMNTMKVRLFTTGYPPIAKNLCQKLVFLHQNTQLFMCWNKCFQMEIIRSHGLRFPLFHRLEDANFVYNYLLYCSNIVFVDGHHYRYCKYIKIRRTLSTSFFNEKCSGLFSLYEKGKKLIILFYKYQINQSDIAEWSNRLERHLESGICGELCNILPQSKLCILDRRKYTQQLLEQYDAQNISSLSSKSFQRDISTIIVMFLSKYHFYLCIALYTYFISFFRIIKMKFKQERVYIFE